MTTALVWVLVTMNGANVLSYSPPIADLETCQFLVKEIGSRAFYPKCIQIKVLK